MRNTLSQQEYYSWRAYMQYRQPDATEQQLAMLCLLISASNGGKSKMDDFLIHTQHKKKPTTPSSTFDMFNAIAKDFPA